MGGNGQNCQKNMNIRHLEVEALWAYDYGRCRKIELSLNLIEGSFSREKSDRVLQIPIRQNSVQIPLDIRDIF
jgi:hypothetical protein